MLEHGIHDNLHRVCSEYLTHATPLFWNPGLCGLLPASEANVLGFAARTDTGGRELLIFFQVAGSSQVSRRAIEPYCVILLFSNRYRPMLLPSGYWPFYPGEGSKLTLSSLYGQRSSHLQRNKRILNKGGGRLWNHKNPDPHELAGSQNQDSMGKMSWYTTKKGEAKEAHPQAHPP